MLWEKSNFADAPENFQPAALILWSPGAAAPENFQPAELILGSPGAAVPKNFPTG
jgi:hypothetical protein